MAFLDDTDTIGLIVLVIVLATLFIAAARCRKCPPGCRREADARRLHL